MVDLRIRTITGADSSLEEETVEGLKSSLRGALLRQGDDGYEDGRKVWNGNIDRRPALIARCTGVADVVEAVNFARTNNLLVAVRGGAHSAPGYATCDGGIVIDLTPMKGIHVDRAKGTVRAQGGVLWVELDRETQAFGLATTGGVVSNTGISGLSLGGGLGWLMGKHGLMCDNLISADVVTADGRFLTASASENQDLFWGVRGGGGNFGVVTSFEYQLHPVGPTILGGMVIHHGRDTREVLGFYRDFSSDLPDEVEAYAALLTSPEGDPVAAMALGYNGSIEEGERLLEPARKFGTPIADLVAPIPYVERQTLFEDLAAHGIQRYWKSGLVPRLDDKVLDIITERWATVPSPMSAFAIFRIHGAASRVDRAETAFGLRQEAWDINIISQWVDPAESEKQVTWTREFWAELEPFATAGVYVNHIAGDEPERVRAAYGPNYDKLVSLKNKYDPTNLFRLNANIKPSG